MLPIEIQRHMVFQFKTAILNQVPLTEAFEVRIKQDIVSEMRAGGKLCDGMRSSLHIVALQKRFLASMLLCDLKEAEIVYALYKSVSQATLDALVFREKETECVTVFTDNAVTEHTGDDQMAVVYGKTIRNNVTGMKHELAALKALRRCCAMAI